MSFGCERSCSSPRRVSNFNSKVPQGGIYPYIKFERDRLNIFRVRVFTSSGSTGGGGGRGDAKTIISPNNSFGDIISYTPHARVMAMALSVLIKTTFICMISCVYSSIFFNIWYSIHRKIIFIQLLWELGFLSTLSIKPGSKMFAHHHRRAGDKTRIRVESMVAVFDLFSLKIVSPLWRNDLVYLSPQVKLFRH